MTDAIGCPECRRQYTRVVDSRPSYERGTIRRRRECYGCGYRWSTYEVDADRLRLLEEEMARRAEDSRRQGPGPETRPPSRF